MGVPITPTQAYSQIMRFTLTGSPSSCLTSMRSGCLHQRGRWRGAPGGTQTECLMMRFETKSSWCFSTTPGVVLPSLATIWFFTTSALWPSSLVSVGARVPLISQAFHTSPVSE